MRAREASIARRPPCPRRASRGALLALLAALATPGCASHERWIEARPPHEAAAARLWWFAEDGPACSSDVVAVATQRGLDPHDREQRLQLLASLKQEVAARPEPALQFAICELASHEAGALAKRDPGAAVGFYAEAVLHGYRAVAVEPRRRPGGAIRAYNDSLEQLLRLLRAQDAVRPGAVVPLPLERGACSIAVELHSRRWTAADFQGFEFADDFQVMGLRNHYHTSGVGVPLIGVRFHADRDHPEDRYYPRKLCYALTAVARAEVYEAPPTAFGGESHTGVRLVLELHDPTDHERLRLDGRWAPLASDLTTPLAYYLDQPDLHEREVSTIGLLSPGSVEQLQGLYLLEPYDPHRMPVVMVHGLWSSPATWMEMFNDLRSDPVVRSRYQFWFYLYPTGSPFWVNAAKLRSDIAAVRGAFDPGRNAAALDQMVLVGHSMGGLLSRLQSVASREDFWRVVSERRVEELDADPEVRRYMSDLFYFQPNPSVQRVVTIGTPHRGSRFANGVTRWLGRKLIAFPMQTLAKRQELFRRNPGFFRPQVVAELTTSIDSLAPDSPMLAALLQAPPGPWVRYHNVVGDYPRNRLTQLVSSRGDGVVSVDSARLDDLAQLASQVVVPADHMASHRHPQAIAEVRRVLLEQLGELDPEALVSTGAGPRAPPATPRPVVRLAGATTE